MLRSICFTQKAISILEFGGHRVLACCTTSKQNLSSKCGTQMKQEIRIMALQSKAIRGAGLKVWPTTKKGVLIHAY